MNKFRLAVLGLAILLAAASSVRAQSQYIGYVYPAGGQQGTTFQIKLGGQGLDDLNEVFDLWLLFGAYPDIRVRNQSAFAVGGDVGELAFDWYISIQGRKYIIEDVTQVDLEKLIKREQEYRGITIGGIKAVTTKA